MDSGWPLSNARVSMDGQDFTARTDALIAVGVAPDRVFTQKGHGEYSVRSVGVDSVLAARRPGDALVVTKLDRLARSLCNATDRVEKLASRWARLIIDGAVCSLTDPVSRLLLAALGFVAEFESDLPAARWATVIPVPYPVPQTAAKPCMSSASGAGRSWLPSAGTARVWN
jgi:DNA invertase Pin-like site-specific DNA recombinase